MQSRAHLRRLDRTWIRHPIYFLTVCIAQRRPCLAHPAPVDILIESWHSASVIHGWMVGRYVIMPDHVHFFAAPRAEAKSLSSFMRDWKKWTTHRLHADGIKSPLVWQSGFFNHVLRSADSYAEKRTYVYENPVRAGLVVSAALWPYSGECERLRF